MNAPLNQFVILSENDVSHLVAQRIGGTWLRVLASFGTRPEAESFAGIEARVTAFAAELTAPIERDTPAEERPAQLPAPIKKSRPPKKVRTNAHRIGAKTEKATALREKLKELWPREMTVVQISNECGVSPNRIYQLKKELGLPDRLTRIGSSEGVSRAAVPKPEPIKSPVTPPAAANGAGLDRNGITIVTTKDEESITFKGETMDLTDRQATLAQLLLRAAPNPVGRDFIKQKIYPNKPDADARLNIIVKDLGFALDGIGLTLKNIAGVGLALGERA